MTEGTLAPLRRRAVTAAGTGLLLICVLAYGNQGLENWRATTFARATGDYQQPLDALNSVTWRLMSQQGGSRAMETWLSEIVRVLVLLIATAFLIHLSTRGVASRRGRWSVFVGSWGATIIAAAIAGAAASPLAVLGKGLPLTVTPNSVVQMYTMISEGLMLGLLVGWLVGLAGVLAYRPDAAEEAAAEPAAKERSADRPERTDRFDRLDREDPPWSTGSRPVVGSNSGSWPTSAAAPADGERPSTVRIGSEALRDPAVRPSSPNDAMRLPPLGNARSMGTPRTDPPTTPDRRRPAPQ